jgi:hypothetical protein
MSDSIMPMIGLMGAIGLSMALRPSAPKPPDPAPIPDMIKNAQPAPIPGTPSVKSDPQVKAEQLAANQQEQLRAQRRAVAAATGGPNLTELDPLNPNKNLSNKSLLGG